MKLNYLCDTCDEEKSNAEMDSFACECGGQMRLITPVAHLSRPFNAGWCDTLKCEVTSWKDQETKAKNHRSKAHPHGFSMIQDDRKFVNELKKQRENKEDILKKERPGYGFGESKKRYIADKPDIYRTGKKVYSLPK